MQIHKFFKFLSVLAFISLALSFPLSVTPASHQEQSVGGLAPDFEFMDIYTNTTHHLSDYQGQVVMLDLWATWCPPCIESIPKMIRLQRSYNASDFVIISVDIDLDESYSQVLSFAQKHNMSWVLTRDTSNMRADYSTGYIPSMYIINQTGYIIYAEIGFDYDAVVSALDQLITADYSPPTIHAPVISSQSNPLNFTNNQLAIQATNITDDFGVDEVFVEITSGTITKTYPIERTESGSIDTTIAVSPTQLFDTSKISISIGTTDFRGNKRLSPAVDMDVELIDSDNSPPEISAVLIEYEHISDQYKFTITATITDDTFVDTVTIKIREEDQSQIHDVKDISRVIADNAFTGIIVLKDISIHFPEKLYAVVTAVDVVGKESTYSTPKSQVTSNTSIFFSILVLLSFSIYGFRKTK